MIEVLTTGPQNTVQDLGRSLYRNIGVAISGAMDGLALRVGNRLLGNPDGLAALEVQTFPLRVRFGADTAIALTGADGQAQLDDQPLLPWWAVTVKAGQTLSISYPRSGARVYLCVAGGIDVPELMGSRSTSLRGGFGGFEGRVLQAGDVLATGATAALPLPAGGLGVRPPVQAMAEVFASDPDGTVLLRAIPAGEYGLFERDQQRFWRQPWKISAQSNRTGYRLSGEPIVPHATMEMRSYGLVPGVVQVPPGGEPIIQLSDANTAGGYPKIAGVIDADLWRLGQAAIGSRIRFVEAGPQEAIAAEQAIEAYLEDMQRLRAML
ncbi:allophanate hydrolase subunit 2 [Pseudomonas sp. StFLB209]|uniref:5-oxoprolinase subunit C family protein n=1 Tax=Pseudomonas sp. StFLB209 TaxID=1028989 RepID=UPI0004F7A6EA|nr:biotin-dependent carboxyltransferase family protein [Pseudomonas sp. StFLB209]BAP45688.1 allophanate hydrolase subunit 2 [Pseudomonas sp. StFLB209]